MELDPTAKTGEVLKPAERVEVRVDINKRSDPIEGPVLSKIWENLRSGRNMTSRNYDENLIIDPETISKAIEDSLKKGGLELTQMIKFLSSAESQILARRINAEIDLGNMESPKSIKGATKLVMFLYYRQQIFNIANIPDVPEFTSIPGELITPIAALKLQERFNYCIKSAQLSGVFTDRETKSFIDFAAAKLKVSVNLSFLLSKRNTPDGDKDYIVTWEQFFGSMTSQGMKQYELLLESSKELHISLKEGLTDYFFGLGYDQKPDGTLVRRKISITDKFGNEHTRNADSRPELLSEHTYVFPDDSDAKVIELLKHWVSGLESIAPSIKAIKDTIKHLIKSNYVNSKCDPVTFRLLESNFDTRLLNEVANRNVAYPAALVTRLEALFTEDGNDIILPYWETKPLKDPITKKYILPRRDAKGDLILPRLFWGDTDARKGGSAGKGRIGSVWPAFALFFGRKDFFTKTHLKEALGVDYVDVELSDAERETQMKDKKVKGFKNAPIYVYRGDKDNNCGRLQELCVKPVIANAYDLVLKYLANLRMAFIGVPFKDNGSSFATGKEPITENLFSPTSILRVDNARNGISRSNLPKWSKMFKLFDGFTSPGSEKTSLTTATDVFDVIKAMVFQGSENEIKDSWWKYVPDKMKIPLIHSAFLTISHAVWHEAQSYTLSTLMSGAESYMLRRLMQIRRLIGNSLFSVNDQKRSLASLPSYPYVSFLEKIYDGLSDEEKEAGGMAKQHFAETKESNPANAFFEKSFFTSIFKDIQTSKLREIDSIKQQAEAFRALCDLSAVKNWLNYEEMSKADAPDEHYLPFLGAFWGDLLLEGVTADKHGNDLNKDLTVRSKQVELVREYLKSREESGKPLNGFDSKALFDFEKNGFYNKEGAKLAKMMADDFKEIVKELEVNQGSQRVNYLVNLYIKKPLMFGFIKRISDNFNLIGSTVNGIEIVNRDVVIKKQDGYYGLAATAYTYRDFCCAVVGGYEYIDTKMPDSYAGEMAGKIARKVGEIRANLNFYMESGEREDLNYSLMSKALNPQGEYKAGKAIHSHSRREYYQNYYTLLSRPCLLTDSLVASAIAVAPFEIGEQNTNFTDGTPEALDLNEVEKPRSDSEHDESLETWVTGILKEMPFVGYDHHENAYRNIFLKIFAGYGRESGMSHRNSGVREIFKGILGWEMKSLNEKEKLDKLRKEDQIEGEGVQNAIEKPLENVGKGFLNKILGSIGLAGAFTKVMEEDFIKNIPSKGGLLVVGSIPVISSIISSGFVIGVSNFAQLGVAASAGLIPAVGLMGVALVFRFADHQLSKYDPFHFFRKRTPEEQHYSYLTQNIILKIFKEMYKNDPKSNFARFFLGNLQQNTSLRFESLKYQLDLTARMKIRNVDKDK